MRCQEAREMGGGGVQEKHCLPLVDKLGPNLPQIWPLSSQDIPTHSVTPVTGI